MRAKIFQRAPTKEMIIHSKTVVMHGSKTIVIYIEILMIRFRAQLPIGQFKLALFDIFANCNKIIKQIQEFKEVTYYKLKKFIS